MGIPTLILYRIGAEVARRTGLQSVVALSELFDLLLTDAVPAPHAGLSDVTCVLAVERLALWVLAAFTGVVASAAGRWGAVAVILFSGVYDRCPLWQAVMAKVRSAPSLHNFTVLIARHRKHVVPWLMETGLMKRLWALLRQRCPVCLRGQVFTSLFGMYTHCPACGVKYERETGYFLN